MLKKIISLVILVLSFNLIFFLQDLFKSELQIYLLGFRLNLFLVINLFLIYFNRDKISNVISFLRNAGKIKNWLVVFFIPVFSAGITILILNQIGILRYKKPEFLIEFGITALTDIPLYYIWNLPLLLSFIVLIILLIEKFTFPRTLLISLILTLSFSFFGFENLTSKLKINELSFWALLFGMIFYNQSVLKFNGSIWISIFSILISIYSYVLVFGSKNSFIIKTFFARTYSQWEGIFNIRKVRPETIDLIFTGLMILFGIFFFIFDRKKSD